MLLCVVFYGRSMHSAELKITGILLAGGMSRRMGREKGMLKFGARHLFQYPLKVLEGICDEILISTCNNSSLPVEHTSVCDEIKGIGPMGGIYTCLKQSKSDLNIVLSYDMPLVSEALLMHLIRESKSFDVILPALSPDHPEPLCGIYRKKTAAVFEKCIRQKIYAVHRALTMTRSKIVLIDKQMSFWQSDMFLNINSEEDLKKLR